MPADPSEVTGAPNALTQVVGVATRSEVLIRNHSGAQVLLYFGADAQPFQVLEAAPAWEASANLTGDTASLQVYARCPTARLALWVTEVTT